MKRTSVRRWKARCMLGRHIPKLAIVEYQPERWFQFAVVDHSAEIYRINRHNPQISPEL